MKIPGLPVPLVLAGVGTTVLLVTACGPDRGGEGWAGQVDALSTGVVVVRSPQEPLWDPAASWTVVETLRVGSLKGDGPEVFGSIGGFVVDREERIWIVDRQTYDLRIFAPDGSHLLTVGRRGGGPGEFGDPIGVTLAPDGRVWVVDPGNARFSIHGPEGDLEESRPPAGGRVCRALGEGSIRTAGSGRRAWFPGPVVPGVRSFDSTRSFSRSTRCSSLNVRGSGPSSFTWRGAG